MRHLSLWRQFLNMWLHIQPVHSSLPLTVEDQAYGLLRNLHQLRTRLECQVRVYFHVTLMLLYN